MRTCLFFFFTAYLLVSTFLCEQSKFIPQLGNILSGVAELGNVISNKDEGTNSIASEAVARINLKVVPSKKIQITKDDMAFLLTELKHEIGRQINILTDELEEKERMRQRAASITLMDEAVLSDSDIDASQETSEEIPEETSVNEAVDEENMEDVAEFIDSLNEIAEDKNLKISENRTYNIEIKDNATEKEKEEEKEKDKESIMSFRKKIANGPLSQ